MRRPAGFSWDDRKYLRNLQLHKVPFEVAALAFDDPDRLIEYDDRPFGYDEDRYYLIGNADGILLYVAHTYIAVGGEGDDKDDLITHLISARKAERSERDEYERNKAERL
ncbi:BrnT family toxin [Beijerinckia sp. L45]|uniref:BrnT family toxin n=1 Tax=Beijerinckia sp. L45 TaxID=1641855 RepID=UPI00131CE00E|nr:BrnT family toxin [Beijerinckia sp. L45]